MLNKLYLFFSVLFLIDAFIYGFGMIEPSKTKIVILCVIASIFYYFEGSKS